MGSMCFLFGHRDAPGTLFPALERCIEERIASFAMTEFVVGAYGGFDRLAAKALLAAKQRHPQIVLTLLLPYLPAKRFSLPEGFDGSLYPTGLETVPPRYAIVRANHYAIDHADHVIAYVWQPASNARNLLAYAQRRAERKECTIAVLTHRND